MLEAFLLALFHITERELLFTDVPSFFLLVSRVAVNEAGASSGKSRNTQFLVSHWKDNTHILHEFRSKWTLYMLLIYF